MLVLVGVLFWKPAPQDPMIGQVPPPEIQQDPVVLPEPETTQTVQQNPEPPALAPELVPPPPPVVQETVKVPPPAPVKPPEVVVKQPEPAAPVKDPKVAKATAGAGNEVVAPLPKPKTLDDAVRGGMAFLKAKAAVFAKETKNDELILWTWFQGGVPEQDPDFQNALKIVLEKKLEKTYNVSLMAMLLEDLDRIKYQKRLAQCAQFLIDNQCANGQWGYGDPSIFVESINVPPLPPKFKGVRKVKVERKRDGPASGDNSNTMYAMLGLRACHDAGILLPPSTVELAAKWWKDTQSKVSGVKAPAVGPEGWCYGRPEHKPYGSMTAGGVGSLAICDYILGRDPKKDRELACGLEWLSKNFSTAYNPGPYEHANGEENSQHQYYYYLYALERAAILTGADQPGGIGVTWFPKIQAALVDAQKPDGSWRSPAAGADLTDTCFAVLTLRKATRALPDVATVAPPKK